MKRRRNPVKRRRSRESRRKRSPLRRRKPWRTLVRRRRKLPVRSKKNICIIRFPKRGYRMNCPLMSWCFDRWIRGSRIPFQVTKPHLSCKKSGPCLRMPFRVRRRSKKKPYAQPRRCPDFLRAALREMAKKEGAKRTVASVTKKRRHYSDNEIFYKLANSLSRRRQDNAGVSERRSEGVVPKISPPTGGT